MNPFLIFFFTLTCWSRVIPLSISSTLKYSISNQNVTRAASNGDGTIQWTVSIITMSGKSNNVSSRYRWKGT